MSECLVLEKGSVIPKGCSFVTIGNKFYREGEIFPKTVRSRGCFITPDYEYQYVSSVSGWHVYVNDNSKEEYGPLYKSINGIPVVSLQSTFKNCENMKKSPNIPKNISYISGAFEGCKNLIEAPKIPDGIIYMCDAFKGCKSMIKAPEIPNSVTDIRSAFACCEKLEKAPIIPENITEATCAFSNCINLRGEIIINANIPYFSHENFLHRCAQNVEHTIVLKGSSHSLDILKSTAYNKGEHVKIC